MLTSRRLNSFAALTLVGLSGMTGAAVAAGPSSEFDLNGHIGTPGVYDYASLSALPPTTQTVTYKAGGTPVTDTFTGTGLWTLLGSAGGITPIPGVKNSSLLNYVVAEGSDGYEAVFSGGEINPMFGGKSAAPDMVAYADSSGPLISSGFARMVVPGDIAGGRYVSNLVTLHVGQAPVPAKGPGGVSSEFTLSGVANSGHIHALIVAGAACDHSDSDLQGRRDPGHGHLHRRFLMDAARRRRIDHRPDDQE